MGGVPPASGGLQQAIGNEPAFGSGGTGSFHAYAPLTVSINEGATIITHETNKALLERAANAPFTIDPDGLSRTHKPLKLETVNAERSLTAGGRTIKLYTMTALDHTDDMAMVGLPKEPPSPWADAYTPPATPLVASKASHAAALVANVRRLNLDVQTVAPLHGMRTADMTEVPRHSAPPR